MRTFIAKKLHTYGPSMLSGTLLLFCFPTFDFFFLAWIALTPFLISLMDKKPSEAFRAGFYLGIPYFFGTLYWIYHSINHYGGVPLIPSLALVFLLCLYLSLYTGVFAALFAWKIATTRLPALFIAPVLWVTLEFLRSYALTGFPWSSLGYSQYLFLPVIQFADVTGIYGVSFLIVAVNGAIADFFIIKKRLRSMPLFPLSHTVIGFSLLFVFIAAVFFYGFRRLDEAPVGKTVRVSVIQGNIEQDRKWDLAYQREVFNTYKDITQAAAVLSPALIVWPETAAPFYFNSDRAFTQELISFQQTLNTYLLFGSVLVRESADGDSADSKNLLTNSAILLAPDGKPSLIYDKIHLVPFGEYVPFRKVLFFLDKLVSGIGDYAPGEHQLRGETPYGSFGVFICYEVVFPGLVRKTYSHGGDFMVTITNDAWFGTTSGPYQHFSVAVFRAVENRKPVIRAANTGISGFIDSRGKILGKTSLFQRTSMTMDIVTDARRSFYSRYGDLFSYLCIVITVLLLINVSRRQYGSAVRT
ncbi:MAG: apolipoprotein N-acyltransferase [Nitrospirae bacterium CG_4_8_14_3_um_filter_44_28]|nr:MAG: apolipoprotein N-acyltransferase [Nitrospirae bacterium CG1_02_44_142]PIW88801.1 MAG: apolipoprotein N-acyltransferase [Nitrospirae bacterium CG_4_8_14_3_um_filter_44_28]